MARENKVREEGRRGRAINQNKVAVRISINKTKQGVKILYVRSLLLHFSLVFYSMYISSNRILCIYLCQSRSDFGHRPRGARFSILSRERPTTLPFLGVSFYRHYFFSFLGCVQLLLTSCKIVIFMVITSLPPSSRAASLSAISCRKAQYQRSASLSLRRASTGTLLLHV